MADVRKFTFPKPMFGPRVAVLYREHMLSFSQDKTLTAEVNKRLYEFYAVSTLPGIRFLSTCGESDLLNKEVLYSGMIVPEQFLDLFPVTPDQWS
jgi:hypothetical protein